LVPFDLLTFVVGLWRRKGMVILGVILSAVLGVSAAILFGVRTWEAETSLLFTGTEGEVEGGVFQTPTLTTQLGLTQLPANLQEVREKLQLKVPLKDLQQATTAFVQKDTSLLVVRAAWNDREMAAKIANNLRDAFLQGTVDLRKRVAMKYADYLGDRLDTVTKELDEADGKLGDFMRKQKVVDLNGESQWLLTQFGELDNLYHQAVSDRDGVEIQLANMAPILAALKDLAAKEKDDQAGFTENPRQLAQLRGILTQKYREQRDLEAGKAQLKIAELEFERAQRSLKQKLISQAEFDTAKANLEAARAAANQTGDLSSLRHEMDSIDATILPNLYSTGGGDDPESGVPILRNVLNTNLTLQLQKVSLDAKVSSLEKARDDMRTRLDNLPEIQKGWVTLQREVTAKETEKLDIRNRLAGAQLLMNLDSPYFSVVSEAVPPDHSTESNRKLIAILVTGLGIWITLALAVIATVMDTSLKSAADSKRRAGVPVLGEVPVHSGRGPMLPAGTDPPLLERFKIVSLAVGRKIQATGTRRLLITSPEPGDGRSLVTSYLAYCFGRDDKKVLVVDGQIRGGHSGPLNDCLEEDDESSRENGDDAPRPGLGEYLSFAYDDYRQVIRQTRLLGVDFVPSMKRAVIPDLLGSDRLRAMLEDASQSYDTVLIDGPPVLPYVDAEILANQCDAILVVLRAGKTTPPLARQAIRRLKACGRPILGVVLNAVDPIYAGRM